MPLVAQASTHTYAGMSVVNKAEDRPENDEAGGDLRKHHGHTRWHKTHCCMYNLRIIDVVMHGQPAKNVNPTSGRDIPWKQPYTFSSDNVHPLFLTIHGLF